MVQIGLRRPSLDHLMEAISSSRDALQQRAAEAGHALRQAIAGNQPLVVVKHSCLASRGVDARLLMLLGMVRELANVVPVVLALDDDLADEPAWLKLLHPRIRLLCKGGPGASRRGAGSRSRITLSQIDTAVRDVAIVTDDPGFRMAGARLHVHDGRWGGAPPSWADWTLCADGVARPRDDGRWPFTVPWWSPTYAWDPLVRRGRVDMSGPSFAGKVVLVVGHGPGIAALSALARLVLGEFVEVAQVAAGPDPLLKLIGEFRRAVPARILELTDASSATLLAQWCEVAAVRYSAFTDSSTMVSAIEAQPPAQPVNPMPTWRDLLATLAARPGA
jgi:hypothetical protein